jgi:chromosome segregation ATPase
VELTAKNLSEKLERAQVEKEILEGEYKEHEAAIEEYNAEIRELKTELENMRNVTKNILMPK